MPVLLHLLLLLLHERLLLLLLLVLAGLVDDKLDLVRHVGGCADRQDQTEVIRDEAPLQNLLRRFLVASAFDHVFEGKLIALLLGPLRLSRIA